ncbi:hypothetical protein BC829DRAFT_195556 [Chytridium lagenaria]|nr:hypothetical protein BC829DRAFT_195556 [Chytridium lagenaria]
MRRPQTRKKWFAKLGYYTLPIIQSDSVVRNYERFFSYAALVQGKGDKKGDTGRSKYGRTKKPGNPLDQSFNLQGFRLVDSEEFAIGLAKTKYFWLGNDMRMNGTTLCFTEIAKEDGSAYPIDRSKSPLLRSVLTLQTLTQLLKSGILSGLKRAIQQI